jgi:hypothetical protein
MPVVIGRTISSWRRSDEGALESCRKSCRFMAAESGRDPDGLGVLVPGPLPLSTNYQVLQGCRFLPDTPAVTRYRSHTSPSFDGQLEGR